MTPPEQPQIPSGGSSQEKGFVLGQSRDPRSLLLHPPPNTGRGSRSVLMGLSPGGICPSPVGTPKPSQEPPAWAPGPQWGVDVPHALGFTLRKWDERHPHSPFPTWLSPRAGEIQAAPGRQGGDPCTRGGCLLPAFWNFRWRRDAGSPLPGMAGGRVAQETLLQSGMCLPWKNLPPLVVKNQLPSRNPKISSFQWEMLGWGMQSFGLR